MKKRLQGILIVLSAAFFLLSAAGCSAFSNTPSSSETATPDPNATLPPEQIVDAEYTVYDAAEDFSIAYHNSWKIKENKSENGDTSIDNAKVVFTIPAGVDQDTDTAGAQVYPTINVFEFSIAEEDRDSFDLQSYVNAQMEYLKSNVYQFTLLKDITSMELNGAAAYTFEYVGSVLNANEVKVKQVFVASSSNVFILTYGANAEFYNNENYGAVAEKIIASFTLK